MTDDIVEKPHMLAVVDGADPEWNNASLVHDWRNHVGERTKSIWYTFTTEQRAAIIWDAEVRAKNEEWE